MHCYSSIAHKVLILLLWNCLITTTKSFTVTPSIGFTVPPALLKQLHHHKNPYSKMLSALQYSNKKDNAIDVEFEREVQQQIQESNKHKINRRSVTSRNERKDNNLSLLDALFEAQGPELADMTIEFVDPKSTTARYIDCKIACVIEMDGLNYTIGAPYETQVAIFGEGTASDDESSQQEQQMNFFLDPDEDANLELMIMAADVVEQKYQADGLKLKRTPRTLTLEGDLNVIVGDDEGRGEINTEWNQIRDETSTTILQELTRSEDGSDDDEYFDNFFRKELGANYEQGILENDEQDEEQIQELMKDVFSIPGIGTERDDDEGIKEMLEDLCNGKDLEKANEYTKNDNQNVETAIRLMGFTGPDLKVYSLVKLVQPIVLVAKEDQKLKPGQRMLLTPTEAETMVPLLEEQLKMKFKDYVK